jgi:hypothetical protein
LRSRAPRTGGGSRAPARRVRGAPSPRGPSRGRGRRKSAPWPSRGPRARRRPARRPRTPRRAGTAAASPATAAAPARPFQAAQTAARAAAGPCCVGIERSGLRLGLGLGLRFGSGFGLGLSWGGEEQIAGKKLKKITKITKKNKQQQQQTRNCSRSSASLIDDAVPRSSRPTAWPTSLACIEIVSRHSLATSSIRSESDDSRAPCDVPVWVTRVASSPCASATAAKRKITTK